MTKTKKTKHWTAKYLFNLNSTHHKRKLFYDYMGFTPTVWTDSETNPQPKTDTEALKGMGETGKALISYNERAKILSMVGSMLGKTEKTPADNHGIGRAHVGLRVPGTATGRCGGTDGVNLQNIPKDSGYLTAMVPEEGHALLTFDICYHGFKTTILTDRGFLPFNQVTKYDKVAAVNPITREILWETPQRIIWKKYTGNMYHFGNRKGTLSVTKGHTMLWAGQQSIGRKKQLRNISKAEQGVPSKMLSSIFTSAKDKSITRIKKEEIWLTTMIQADAYLLPNGSYRVEVSRPEKVLKVEELLGVPAESILKIRGSQTMEPHRFPTFNYKSKLLQDKSLFLEKLGSNQADTLFKALAFWDGHVRGNRLFWSSTDKKSFDQIMRYFSRSDYTVLQGPTRTLPNGKPYYYMTITKQHSTRITRFSTSHAEGLSVGCVTVSTGFVLVQSEGLTFVSGNCALEPTVLTSASGDKTLNAVYGPNAPAGMDIYSFVGAQLGGELGKAIAATGYDWKNPTAEATAKVKKEAKKWRSIAKLLHLSASYGAGPGKIRQSLGSSGIEISMHDVKQLHVNYWKLFAGVKEYEQHLISMWENNGGWFINPAGLPQAIAQDRIRDIVNSSIQGGSHYLFMVMTKILGDVMREHNIDYRPYVWDIHDCVMFTVPKEQADKAKELADGLVLARFNDEIKGSVTLRADANIVENWWEDKKE